MGIRSETKDAVATIAFDRPDKKNAITAAMYAALADAFEGAGADAAVRCVLLAGSTACFTAGNDLEDFLNDPPHGDDSAVFRFLRAISTCVKPIVAAPCGPAIGIGTTMLLHCDLVYAGDNARFSLPFAQLGLCPEAASSLLLPKLAGHARAAEKLLLGEPFAAEEARELGIVNRVLPAAEAIAFAHAQAAKIAALPPESIRTTKRLLKHSQREAVRERMAEEGESFRRMLGEPAAREAFTDFLERRKPDFSRLS